MLRIALGFSKNMHKYMLILCIFIHIFRNIMHKVDAYFSSSVKNRLRFRIRVRDRIRFRKRILVEIGVGLGIGLGLNKNLNFDGYLE
jgi:hypothetical protein